MSALTTTIQHYSRDNREIRQRNEIKGIQNEKKVIKLFVLYMILYIEHTKEL